MPRTLLFTDLVDSTKLVEKLGDTRALEVAIRHDRVARDLLPRFDGLEIDKADGFLLLFAHPLDAVGYALAYHQVLTELSIEFCAQLRARAGIHLGEVFLRRNPPEDVARGAKPLEVGRCAAQGRQAAECVDPRRRRRWERRPASAREMAEKLRTLEQRHRELAAHRRAREEAENARQALARAQRRRKVFGAMTAVAAVVLTVVSVLAVLATRARDEATRAQQIAESRRKQAEKLISFMLGDLEGKLEPLGRLDVLNEIGDQAMEYFASVPPEELSVAEINQRSKALIQIAEVRLEEGDLNASMAARRQSQALVLGLVERDPDNVEWQKHLAASHFFIGRISWEQGDVDAALDRFQAQLEISQRLSEKHPDDPDLQLELAHSHNNVGFVQRARGELPQALATFRSVLGTLEEIIVQKPKDRDVRFEYAGHSVLVGSLLWQFGELKSAMEHYETGRTVAEELIEQEPENTTWQQQMATIHNRIGRALLAAGDQNAARPHFRAALKIAEHLISIEPNQTRWQRELAIANRYVAHDLMLQGDLDKAMEHAQQGAGILSTLVEKESIPAWKRDLGLAHLNVARVRMAQDNLGDARRQARLALALLEALAEQNPEDHENQHRLAESLLFLGQTSTTTEHAREVWTRVAVCQASS